MAAGQRRVAVTEGKEFWTTQFAKPDTVIPERFQFFWSWSTDGTTWQAPENPRWNLARYPAVFKLYALRNPTQKTKVDDGPISSFLIAFLPELEKSLGVPAS